MHTTKWNRDKAKVHLQHEICNHLLTPSITLIKHSQTSGRFNCFLKNLNGSKNDDFPRELIPDLNNPYGEGKSSSLATIKTINIYQEAVGPSIITLIGKDNKFIKTDIIITPN